MHVSHFEAGALTGQTARAKGRNTALMRDFGQRFVWSMNCESWLEPKNSRIEAEIGLLLIRSWPA